VIEQDQNSIEERDMDRALAAFLSKLPEFRLRLLNHVGAEAFSDEHGGQFLRARVSVVDRTGETDLIAEWQRPAGDHLILLVEHKLTASFQPRQGARYAARANTLSQRPGMRALTLLVAPGSYLSTANPEARHFNFRVSLEDVASWASDTLNESCVHELGTVREAIQRVAAGGPLGAKGLFHDLHLALAVECERRSNGLSITNRPTDWVFFDHPILRTGMEIHYRISDAISEIALTKVFRFERSTVQSWVFPPFHWHLAGGSAFIRRLDISVSRDARAGRASERDVSHIVDSLEALVRWWEQWAAGTVAAALEGRDDRAVWPWAIRDSGKASRPTQTPASREHGPKPNEKVGHNNTMATSGVNTQKAIAMAAFRRKATYYRTHKGTKLQEGLGLTISEMDAILAERGLPPVTDQDLSRWNRKRV
jgi:hypothetical protein